MDLRALQQPNFKPYSTTFMEDFRHNCRSRIIFLLGFGAGSPKISVYNFEFCPWRIRKRAGDRAALFFPHLGSGAASTWWTSTRIRYFHVLWKIFKSLTYPLCCNRFNKVIRGSDNAETAGGLKVLTKLSSTLLNAFLNVNCLMLLTTKLTYWRRLYFKRKEFGRIYGDME
jgi:hypothetical protein